MKTNHEKLEFIRKYAKLLDSQFQVPGTKFRFGIDPILSLIPIIGTFSGFISGLILIALSHRQGVSGKVKVLMFKNTLIDYIIGLIPIYGNIKDFFYKANQKNVLLIEEHLLEDKHQGSGIGLILIFGGIALLFFITSIILFSWILTKIMEFFFN